MVVSVGSSSSGLGWEQDDEDKWGKWNNLGSNMGGGRMLVMDLDLVGQNGN